eukprot:m.236811 g.236811  ORF g.236811 m.236811 type:complete len:1595 (-) comp20784_c0_seq1:67-4851(-)
MEASVVEALVVLGRQALRKCDRKLDKALHQTCDSPVQLLAPLFMGTAAGGDAERSFQALLKSCTISTSCGREFESNEPTYTCLDCANDPTCVFCHSCFHNSEHMKHKYRMHMSGGGGCCDCGDSEAWKQHHSCSLHSTTAGQTPAEQLAPLPPALRPHIFSLLSTLIAHCGDVLCRFPEGEEPVPVEKYGVPLGQYCVVLLNDEQHSYDDVIGSLKAVFRVASATAAQMAERVDKFGRSVVWQGPLPQALAYKQHMNSVSTLNLQVIDTAVFLMQQAAVAVLVWLTELARDAPSFRRLLCTIMAGQADFAVTLNPSVVPPDGSHLSNIFLAYSNLWHYPRRALRSFLIALLFESDFKLALSRRFVHSYRMIQAQGLQDVQHDQEALPAFSVQLFTTPSVACALQVRDAVVSCILDTLSAQLAPLRNPEGRYAFDAEMEVLQTGRIAWLAHDISYILKANPPNLLPSLPPLLALLAPMQGCSAQVRKVSGDHVLFEDNTWLGSLTLLLNLGDIFEALPAQIAQSPEEFNTCVGTILNVILAHDAIKVAVDAFEPDVLLAGHPVLARSEEFAYSFHCPLQRLLAFLFQTAHKLHHPSPLDALSSFPTAHPLLAGLAVVEAPLACFVVAAQVRARQWLRNGTGMAAQMINYQSLMAPLMYTPDIGALQIGFCALPHDYLLSLMLRRFGLEDWLRAEAAADPSIIEDMMTAITLIFTERFSALTSAVPITTTIRRHIIHALLPGPLSHSDFRRHVRSTLREHPEFDDILRQVSNPRNKGNALEFVLKPECISEVSPCCPATDARLRAPADAAYQEWILTARPNPLPATLPLFHSWLEPLSLLPVSALFLDIASLILKLAAKPTPARPVSDQSLLLVLYTLGVAVRDDQARAARGAPLVFVPQFVAAPEGRVSLAQLVAEVRDAAHFVKKSGKHSYKPLCAAILDAARTLVPGGALDALCGAQAETDDATRALRAKGQSRRDKAMQKFKKLQGAAMKHLEAAGDEDDGAARPSGGAAAATAAGGEQGEAMDTDAARAPEAAGELCIFCRESHEGELVHLAFAQVTLLDPAGCVLPPAAIPPTTATAINGTSFMAREELRPVSVLLGGCGHIAHLTCCTEFEASRAARGYVLCPLCAVPKNIFVPHLPPPAATAAAAATLPLASGAELLQSTSELVYDAVSEEDNEEHQIRDFIASLEKSRVEWRGSSITRIVVFSIAALEAAARTPDSTLTAGYTVPLLRSLVALNALRPASPCTLAGDFREPWAPHLLYVDPFAVLVDAVTGSAAAQPHATRGLVFVSLLLQMMQTCVSLLCCGPDVKEKETDSLPVTDDDVAGVQAMFTVLASWLHLSPVPLVAPAMVSHVRQAMVPFLRRACIFVRCLQGRDVLSGLGTTVPALLVELHLPLFESLAATLIAAPGTSVLVTWLSKMEVPLAVGFVPRPLPYTRSALLDLPQHYVELFTRTRAHKCPSTGLPASRVTMCLSCGLLLCDMCFLCRNSQNQATCSSHIRRCGGSQGMFLQVQQCSVMLLFNNRGCLLPAPYTDQYGETDIQLKRGAPLTLNPALYQKLQDLWRRHTVFAEVARYQRANARLEEVEWEVL